MADAYNVGYLAQRIVQSRRRNTRYIGDWSSDVCSSDITTSRPALSLRARTASSNPAWSFDTGLPIVDAFRTFVACPPPSMRAVFQSLVLVMVPWGQP